MLIVLVVTVIDLALNDELLDGPGVRAQKLRHLALEVGVVLSFLVCDVEALRLEHLIVCQDANALGGHLEVAQAPHVFLQHAGKPTEEAEDEERGQHVEEDRPREEDAADLGQEVDYTVEVNEIRHLIEVEDEVDDDSRAFRVVAAACADVLRLAIFS